MDLSYTTTPEMENGHPVELGPCWECGRIYNTRYGVFRANVPTFAVKPLNFCSNPCHAKHPREYMQARLV